MDEIDTSHEAGHRTADRRTPEQRGPAAPDPAGDGASHAPAPDGVRWPVREPRAHGGAAWA